MNKKQTKKPILIKITSEVYCYVPSKEYAEELVADPSKDCYISDNFRINPRVEVIDAFSMGCMDDESAGYMEDVILIPVGEYESVDSIEVRKTSKRSKVEKI